MPNNLLYCLSIKILYSNDSIKLGENILENILKLLGVQWPKFILIKRSPTEGILSYMC